MLIIYLNISKYINIMSKSSSSKNTKNNKIKANKINKRLLKDVADVLKNPLISNGIYYIHDESNAYKGYAMIIGPSDTLYRYGYYFFDFTFPQDYPFSPPKVIYLTNDGTTRFNPNLYRNGKVCLSILNTWKGEQWTSCQSLRSVLLTLVSLFHNKPLLNEPGVSESNKNFKIYNKIIEHQNIKTAVLKVIKQNLLPEPFWSFWIFIKKTILDNKNEIIEYLTKLQEKYKDKKKEDKILYCSMYNMNCTIDYANLLIDFNNIIKFIQN